VKATCHTAHKCVEIVLCGPDQDRNFAHGVFRFEVATADGQRDMDIDMDTDISWHVFLVVLRRAFEE
jgi:hypothetical protein